MIARLERLRPKLGYPQLDLAGLGLQLALVVTGPPIATGLAALVTLRIAQAIRLGVQKRVQRLLHAAANIVNRDDIAQSTRCILGHGGLLLLTWLRLATSSSARFGGRQPYPIVRNIPYVIHGDDLHSAIN
jgi:hypothetical protein